MPLIGFVLVNVGLDGVNKLSRLSLADEIDSVLYDVGVLGGVKLLEPVCSLRFFLASLSFSSVI